VGSHPLISVIIPVFNGERYLGEAIQSALAQTYRPLHIMVIDDGSTDDSAAVARTFSDVQYAFQPHAGLGSALNRGLGMARGDFLSFLDADDLWVEHKLATQVGWFRRDPALDVVYGRIRPFRGHDAPHGYREFAPTAGYVKGTMLITRSAFFRVGLFDPKWTIGDFVDWYVRAEEMGLKSLMLPEVLLKRRIHSNNMGVREKAQRKDYARILKRALDRRNIRPRSPADE
jgi:glycosyltransferase involved in cell wall biosynthesis